MHADAAPFCTPAMLLWAGRVGFGRRGFWKTSNVDVVIALSRFFNPERKVYLNLIC